MGGKRGFMRGSVFFLVDDFLVVNGFCRCLRLCACISH